MWEVLISRLGLWLVLLSLKVTRRNASRNLSWLFIHPDHLVGIFSSGWIAIRGQHFIGFSLFVRLNVWPARVNYKRMLQRLVGATLIEKIKGHSGKINNIIWCLISCRSCEFRMEECDICSSNCLLLSPVIHLIVIYQTAVPDMKYYDNYSHTQNIYKSHEH